MDLDSDDLEHLGPLSIVATSIAIARSTPAHFSVTTVLFVLPLSLSLLAYSATTHLLIRQLYGHPYSLSHPLFFIVVQSLFVLFLLSLSLLSIAAVVYTVASLYTAKSISISHLLAVIPALLKPLFSTFQWVLLRAVVLCTCLMVELVLFLSLIQDTESRYFGFTFLLLVIAFFLLGTGLYFSAEWRLSCIVSVLEEVRGRQVIRKSRALLRGKMLMGCLFALAELVACSAIGVGFSVVVVDGNGGLGTGGRWVVGIWLLGMVVVVNLVGLLVQSVFYHACKAYHHEGIDKSTLYVHLDEYVGETSVPLTSSIEMGNVE